MNKPLLVLGTLSLVALNGCDRISQIFGGSQQQAPAMPVMPVTVLDARPVNLPVKADLPGRVEPLRQAEVRARVSGILLKREYTEGQDVREGDVLFRIDPAPYEAAHDACVAAVRRAEANLANIQDKERRYRPLAEKGTVSQRDHVELQLQEKMALAELASAKAELKRADLELSYTRVTSPIDGRARAELVTEGALVGHGTPTALTTVEQLDPIYVKFTQPASEIVALKNGVRQDGWQLTRLEDLVIEVVMPGGVLYETRGRLVFSDVAVNPDTDTVQMKAIFDNPNYELIPGSYVRVRFDRAVRSNVYLVPRVAVSKTTEGTFVYIVGNDNKVEVRPVVADQLEGSNWIVTSGLNPGDKVITERSLMLVHPGSTVTIGKIVGADGREIKAAADRQQAAQAAQATQ